MNKQKPGQIIKQYHAELVKQLEQAKQLDEDAVHHYRTTYKKLRAFLRMAKAKDDGHATSILPKEIKKVYGLLGNIRDMQLQRKRMLEPMEKARSKTVAYRNLLENRIGILNQQLALFDLPDKQNKVHAAISRKILEGFVKVKLHDAHKVISSKRFTDINLHTIRKDLKDVFYNMQLFKHEGLLKTWWEANKEWLHGILHELGNYQDRHNAILLLNANRLYSLNSYDQASLKTIRDRWSDEKLESKAMLIDKLTKGDFLNHTVS